MPSVTDAEIERVFREEFGRAVAVLVRSFGDIDIAEEAVQDAFTVAVQRWPETGLPPSPAGWIITTARRRAIDRLRGDTARADRYAKAALMHAENTPIDDGPVRDERLRLRPELPKCRVRLRPRRHMHQDNLPPRRPGFEEPPRHTMP